MKNNIVEEKTIAIDKILVKANIRRVFDEKQLKELTDNVAKVGILQSLLVRNGQPDGKYVLVAGERRLRAAKAAGLKEVPVRVLNITEQEAAEIQVFENLHRTDLHPMEEAEGYEELMKSHGYTADQIADKVGKSKAYVYGRLKLIALCETARKAFWKGDLNPSTALLIARIPDPALQQQALEEITEGWNGPMSYREAAEHVQERYMLRLKEAPFDTRDPNLVATVGACASCPFRTGNQQELFADVQSADVCTKPPCYEAKKKAAGEKVMAQAKAKGQEVLIGPAAEKAMRYGSGFLDLKDCCHEDPKNRSWSTLLRNLDVPRTVAQDQRGEIHELVPAAAAAKALKDAGHLFATKTMKEAANQDRYKQDRKKEAEKEKIRAAVDLALMAELVDAAKKQEDFTLEFWQIFAQTMAEYTWHDAQVRVMNRREPSIKGDVSDRLKKLIRSMKTLQDIFGLIVELNMSREFGPYRQPQFLPNLLKLWHIDRKVIEHRVKSDLKKAKR